MADLVTVTDRGLCCRPGGFHVDPWRPVDRAVISYWEAMAHVRWAVIALQQTARHLSGRQPDLELALIGLEAEGGEDEGVGELVGESPAAEHRRALHLHDDEDRESDHEGGGGARGADRERVQCPADRCTQFGEQLAAVGLPSRRVAGGRPADHLCDGAVRIGQ